MKAVVLSLFLRVSLRLLLLRDTLTGRRARLLANFPLEQERLTLRSDDRTLAAVHLSAGPHAPAILICHGIGELVEYWATVQQTLQAMGVSTLVFDYSGYGASTGTLTARHCEEDAVAACQALAAHGYRHIILLGYSLGGGVVAAIAARLPICGTILCESFTTLREAAMAIGLPRPLTHLIPDTWRTLDRVRTLKAPILIVHSDADQLFPVSTAKRLVDEAGDNGKLIILKGLSHNAPIFAPPEHTQAYWQAIADWTTTIARQP